MEVGTIGTWNLKAGDSFNAGDVIAEIETDKATMGFEAQDPGVVAKILVEAGQEIAVGIPVVVIVDDADDASALVAAFADFTAEGGGGGAVAAAEEAPAAANPAGTASGASVAAVEGRSVAEEYLLMPSASHLAASHGLDVRSLAGSGKGGRITKGDLLSALAAGTAFPPRLPAEPLALPLVAPSAAAAVVVAGTQEEVQAVVLAPTAAALASAAAKATPPLAVGEVLTTNAPGEDTNASTMRKIIAKRLTESKGGVPHCYCSVECELDTLLAFRKTLAQDHDVKVSVNDLIIRSAALALRDVPEMNASFDPVAGKPKLNSTIDVSVAVATPGGLITPIVTAADKRGLSDITEVVRELAGRARLGKLLPHEFQGGTFSVSNLGMFGVGEFSAVINPPQAVIMAVGGGVPTVVPGRNPGDKPRVASVMTARISVDRRVGDEALSGQFLQAFQAYMSQPQLLML